MQCDFKKGMKIPKGGFVQGGQLMVPIGDYDDDEQEDAGEELQRKLGGLNVSEITDAGPQRTDGEWRGACAVCGVETTTRCSGCREKGKDYAGPYYCGRAHQKTPWKAHKKVCLRRSGEQHGLDVADIVFSLTGPPLVRLKNMGRRPITEEDLDGVAYVRTNGTSSSTKQVGAPTTKLSLMTVVELQHHHPPLGPDPRTADDKTWYKGTTVANCVLVEGKCWQDTMFGSAMREDWRTRDGAPMKVRDVVGLVMLRFATKQPPNSNDFLYSETSRVTVLEDKTLAERGEDGRTFGLMSWIGTSGPTYLTK